MNIEIETKEFAGITVVYLSGQLVSATHGEVSDSLVKMVEGGVKKMLLNLRGLEYITSAGLRSILVPAKLQKGRGGQLRMCEANETVSDILKTSGFVDLIKLHESEAEAVSAFH
jgi:anti-sigma B factor antagonist